MSNAHRLMPLPEITEALGLPAEEIARLQRAGLFPDPVAGSASAWRERDVSNWARAGGASTSMSLR